MTDREANPDTVLAAYGSLRPGEPNHWVVSRVAGDWVPGTVRGWSFEISWGPADGYDGFLPDPEGSEVSVDVLMSDALAKNWASIDDFEGSGYERQVITVELADGTQCSAMIYVALTNVE